MKRCAFLSTDDLAGFVTDDQLAIAPFREKGWDVDIVSWRQRRRSWTEFDAAIVRSTWDYQKDPALFVAVLEDIDRSGVALANPLPMLRWNLSKTYLRELAARNVPVVPTLWFEHAGTVEWGSAFAELSASEVIVKPVIGASAGDTWRLTFESLPTLQQEIENVFQARGFMIQPFIPAVLDEGEYSLFWFGDRYSHSVRKVPKPLDFRVQEEHGGEITAVVPPAACMETASEVLASLEDAPLYARVDLIRNPAGQFVLMELELIEPALYLRTDQLSAQRFADAFEVWYARRHRSG